MTSDLFSVLWDGTAAIAVAVLLAGIAVCDLRSRRIPNALVIALVAVWALLHLGLCAAGVSVEQLPQAASMCGVPVWMLGLFRPVDPLKGLITAAVVVGLLSAVALLYEKASGKPAMGAGDVKLIGALALFAGPWRLMVSLMIACAAALVASSIVRRRTFPFAPALVFGFFCAILVEL